MEEARVGRVAKAFRVKKWICDGCSTNEHVATWIRSKGRAGTCSFCNIATRLTVDLDQLAAYADPVIGRSTHPAFDEEIHGPSDRPENIVSDLAGVSKEVAREIVNRGRLLDDASPSRYDLPWARSTTLDLGLNRDWNDLLRAVRHESRYFGPRTREILDTLFGDIETFGDAIAVRELPVGAAVFRGRAARNHDEAKLFLAAPQLHLQAPPTDKAVPGRMNSEGIRVFYGALREEVAVAELRPPVGSNVVVGQFSLIRPLRVLELAHVSRALSRDPFAPDASERIRKATFLWLLQTEIGRPVQPLDPPLSYLPTQIIADYISQIVQLDGIAYISAQFNGHDPMSMGAGDEEPRDRNVAFFRSSARTEGEGEGEESGPPALRFIEGSARMLDIRKVSLSYGPNMWAHYVDPPQDEDSEEEG